MIYLKTGNVTKSEEFFVVQAIFLTQEYRRYFKGKWHSTAEKELLLGCVDVFR